MIDNIAIARGILKEGRLVLLGGLQPFSDKDYGRAKYERDFTFIRSFRITSWQLQNCLEYFMKERRYVKC